MKKQALLVLALLLLLLANAFSQIKESDDYVIVMFREKTTDNYKDVISTDFWIYPGDTLAELASLTRLFFEKHYDAFIPKKCNAGHTFASPSSFTTIWELGRFKNYDSLAQMISAEPNKLQTIKQGDKEIEIYAAAVKGDFCKCHFRNQDNKLLPIYTHQQTFTLVDTSRNSTIARLKEMDFSKFDFHFLSPVKKDKKVRKG